MTTENVCDVCDETVDRTYYFELEHPTGDDAPGFISGSLCFDHATGVYNRITAFETGAEPLCDDQRIVYEIVAAEGEARMRSIYEQYRTQVDKPVTKRSLRNWLADMDEKGLIDRVGDRKRRRYRALSSSQTVQNEPFGFTDERGAVTR